MNSRMRTNFCALVRSASIGKPTRLHPRQSAGCPPDLSEAVVVKKQHAILLASHVREVAQDIRS
jgi:hypothetical protein